MKHDDMTLVKVRQALIAGLEGHSNAEQVANEQINEMLNAGIIFREHD